MTDPSLERQDPHSPGDHDGGEPDEEHPLGTLFVLMIFITVLAGMWGAMYLTLLGR